MKEPIDYRKLLLAYIEHVGREEGITYLAPDRLETLRNLGLSEGEIDALVEADQESDAMDWPNDPRAGY